MTATNEVGRDVEVLEELGCDGVVAAFGKVPGADKVASAEADADVQVWEARAEAGVVEGDVGV